MSAPSWIGEPRPLPTEAQRSARHSLLTFPDSTANPPGLPPLRSENDRIADTRAALRDARDAAVRAYRNAAGGRMTLDELHATLASIAAAQTALDGEAPRRQFAPRSGSPPVWANCGGPRETRSSP